MLNIQRVWLVDLDGVMNSGNLRNHLIPATEMAKATAMGWFPWHAAHTQEAVNDSMIDFVNAEHADGNAVLFVTMRLSSARESTIKQLRDAGLAFNAPIWMRSEDDDTPPPASRAAAVLDAINAFGALRQPVQIGLIDDSADNIKAVHDCPHIQKHAAHFGSTVLTVLYPAFKGVE